MKSLSEKQKAFLSSIHETAVEESGHYYAEFLSAISRVREVEILLKEAKLKYDEAHEVYTRCNLNPKISLMTEYPNSFVARVNFDFDYSGFQHCVITDIIKDKIELTFPEDPLKKGTSTPLTTQKTVLTAAYTSGVILNRKYPGKIIYADLALFKQFLKIR